VVRIPSRCARITASLIERDRPKSSAFTMSRVGVPPLGGSELALHDVSRASTPGVSGSAIVRRSRAENKPAPRTKNQQQLLRLVKPRRLGAKNIELLPL